MKEKWLMASEGPWEEMKPKITTALESGFDCVVAKQEDVEKVRKLGDILVASFGTTCHHCFVCPTTSGS